MDVLPQHHGNNDLIISRTFVGACIILGGNIAASWAAIKSLGEDGYMNKAKALMGVTEKMKNKIKEIEVSRL